jgi:hypothetical protein
VLLDHLIEPGQVLCVEYFSLEDIFPIGSFLLVDGDGSPVDPVHDDQHWSTSHSHAGREEDALVTAVYVEQKLLHLLLALIAKHHLRPNCRGQGLGALSYESHIFKVFASLKKTRVFSDGLGILDDDPKLLTRPRADELLTHLLFGSVESEGETIDES